MAGSNDLTRWQNAVRNQIERVLNLDSFKDDVYRIRELPKKPTVLSDTVMSKVYDLLDKYSLPDTSHKTITKYIMTGELDYDLVDMPARVTRDELGAGANLHIDLNVTKSELIEYIKTYWDEDIEPVLARSGRKRQSSRPKLNFDRDTQILNLHRKGKSAREICDALPEYSLDSDMVHKIVSRNRPKT